MKALTISQIVTVVLILGLVIVQTLYHRYTVKALTNLHNRVTELERIAAELLEAKHAR